MQLNAITKALKNLPHKPNVIYDAHEAYHLLMLDTMPRNVLQKRFYKFYISLVSGWEISHASYCDYIIATDEYTLGYFEKKLPEVHRIIIYNYSFFTIEHNVERKVKYDFIYSGLLSKTRGIKEIVIGIQQCKIFFPDIKLLLIGLFDDKNFETEINQLIKELWLTGNVIIKSGVPFSEISYYYNLSRIGVCLLYETPKYTTAIPIKLFEYMAFGLPVIASDHGATAVLVKECNCGVLVNVHSIEQISEAMIELLTDHALAYKLNQNGTYAVKKKYNWQKEKEKLIGLYKTLLKNEG